MASIIELVTQLASNDQVKAYQARRQLKAQVDRVTDPSKAQECEALAGALAAELMATSDRSSSEVQVTNVPGSDLPALRPKHSTEVRRLLCQLLCQIASDSQLPELTAGVNDLEIRETVRWVLECIPTPLANQELVNASGQVGPDFRIGVLNALAKQRWREALTTLARQTLDPDAEARLAAIEGLAHFPEAASDQLILAATQSGSPREQARAQHARIQLAATLHEAGEKRDAIAIYRSILSGAPEGPWKTAARRGLEQLQAKAG